MKAQFVRKKAQPKKCEASNFFRNFLFSDREKFAKIIIWLGFIFCRIKICKKCQLALLISCVLGSSYTTTYTVSPSL